ncbi:hypothetical protein EXIGLDRAFT_576534, partial [Exidia glandulosa HHB12029]
LRVHHGAVDQGTVTTGSPPEVFAHVTHVLASMGVEFHKETEFKYRCVRPKRRKIAASANPPPSPHKEDLSDEVRFSVELTRIDRLDDTLSLDIRRLKGNLKSYKFLYDTLRE